MHKDLVDPKTEEALSALPHDAGPLECLKRLRAQFPQELARQAAHLFELRKRCKPRIGSNLLPYLREPNASQVSAPAIAGYRASEVAKRGPTSRIWEATAGLGMDAVHLAKLGLPLVATDRSAEVTPYTLANLRFHGSSAGVVQADACGRAIRAEAIVLDPDRRSGGQRTLDPDRWSPTLSRCLQQANRHQAAVLKLPPAWTPPEDWFSSHHLEWISVRGELLECTLWLGTWAEKPGSCAVVLPAEGPPVRYSAAPESSPPLSGEEALEPAYLYDPDPALVRSGLLGAFANQHGLSPLAPNLGYLAGPGPVRSPFVRCFSVLASSPYSAKAVQKMLSGHDIGPVQVRMRGHRERPEALAKRWQGPGLNLGHLAVARLDRARRVYLLDPQ